MRSRVSVSAASVKRGVAGLLRLAMIIPWLLACADQASASPFAFVTNAFSHSVSVIDTASSTVTGSVVLPETRVPFAVAIAPDGKHAFVTTLNALQTAGGSVFSIDTASNSVAAGPIVVGDEPTGIAITPDGRLAYVSNRFFPYSSGKNISVIDTARNVVIAALAIDGMPRALAITPDGKRVYVTNENIGTVWVIDIATNTILGEPIATAGAYGIAIAPDGKRAYVTNGRFPGGGVAVIDTMSNAVVATIAVEDNPGGVAVTPDGKHAYVARAGARSVSVIDTASNTLVGNAIEVGVFPGAIAIAPDGKHAYVTNEGSDTVSVIDIPTNSVVSTIQGVSSPRDVAITPATFGVTYDGNLNTGGSVPVDGNSYVSGATVTVLGNTGDLVRAGYTFGNWNTAASGTGAPYVGGATFAMGPADVTLYAHWSATGSAPVLVGARSRKVHGTAGAFDLVLALTSINPTTEPRAGPTQTIVFSFDKPVTAGVAALSEGTATVGAPTFSGNDMTVPLTAVFNAQYVTVNASDVVASDGGTGGTGSVRIGFLFGDSNQSRQVTVADVGVVNAALLKPVTLANFLFDVNSSGSVTVADKGLVNANLLMKLPLP
jgi:uncharacterized repeat protein (TIGR02543 family)